ncbi:hypothetical protein KO498_06400 [Lentibacter algarum]|uniref:WD40 repeat domain-containing protein n=1 Tax=Lentibacter algarum TaxID=576131 RepID=UPI001C0685C2|nr:WD40 repeat domain-containing protein [Lentibacter algarum]MBU2981442.1 hypothetical protein [Lentibacter algarum]
MAKSTGVKALPEIKIFLSSPGDVNEERVLAGRVLQRLTERYAPVVKLVPIIWEHEPLVASATFQDQIEKPSTTDIVICILWSRLGTRLPAHIVRDDGSRYDSGTEFEFEDAWDAIQRTGRPDLLVYRKMAEPFISLASNSDAEERLRQKRALDGFIEKWFHDQDGSLLAAFHGFGNSAEFEEAFETHLDKLIQRRLEELGIEGLHTASTRDVTAQPLWEGSPFRGLETFEFEHAPVFYGRTHAISGVLKTLRAQAAQGNAFVLVLGRSGGGKSSLVRAGVLPLLVEPGVVEGVGLWRRAVFRPSEANGSLNAAFAAALSAPLALPELLSDGTTVDELGQLLDTTPKGADMLLKGALSQAAQKASMKAAEDHDAAHPDLTPEQRALDRREITENPPTAKLVLLVDQLEELLTDPNILQSERDDFLKALTALAGSGRVYVVATLRSDFYQQAIEQPVFAQLKGSEGQYDLSAPTPAEIGQIIRQPALRAGLTFEEHPETGARLDDDLRDAAVAEPDSLPLLEFTLEELYRARSPAGVLTWEAYEALGGLAGALGRRAEEAFNKLPAAAQATLPQAMRQIVHVRLDRDQAATKRAANMEDFQPGTPVRQLIDAFVDARLFVVGGDSAGKTVVTLTHEALLWSWPRLQQWLEDDQEYLRIRARVSFAADRWEEADRAPQLLLPIGPALDESRQITEDSAANVSPSVTSFIALSVARATRSRRLKQAAIATLAVLTFGATATAWYADGQRREAASARVESEAAQLEAESNAETAQTRLGELFFEQGRQALLDGRAEEATLLLGAAYGSANDDHVGALFSTAHDLASIRGATTLESSGQITKLATGVDNLVAIAADDGSVVIRDIVTGERLARHQGDDSAIKALAFSPDGKFVALGADGGNLLLWDYKAQTKQRLEAHFQAISQLYFSADGTRLASLSHDKTTLVWNVTSGDLITTLPELGGQPVSARFTEDGEHIVTLSSEGDVSKWNSTTGREMFRCKTQATLPVLDGLVLSETHAVLAHGKSGLLAVTIDESCETVWQNPTVALGLDVANDRKHLLVRNELEAVIVDAQTGETVTNTKSGVVDVGQSQIIAANLSPDGGMMGTIDNSGTLTLTDASSAGGVVAKLKGHAASGSAITFLPDGNTLATAAVDGTVTAWNLSTLRPCVLPGGAGHVVTFAPGGKYVASGDSTGRMTLADLADCANARVFSVNPDREWMQDIVFSDDGAQVVTASGSFVSLSEVTSGDLVWQYRLPDGQFATSLAWNHNNSGILVGASGRELGSSDGGWVELNKATGTKMNESSEFQTPVSSLQPWNEDSYVLTRSSAGLYLWWQDTGLQRHRVADRKTRAVAYWPDKTRLAVGNSAGQVHVIRHTTSELFHFEAHAAPVSALALDAKGSLLASGANDGSAALWNADSGTLVAELIGHSSRISSMKFVPNSSYVLSAATNGTVILWDLKSGSQVARFDGPSGPRPQLAVGPNGVWFAVATGRGNTRLWRLPRLSVAVTDIVSEISSVTPWGLNIGDELPQDRWQVLALEALGEQLDKGDLAVSLETRQRLEAGRAAAVRGDALAAGRSWQQIDKSPQESEQSPADLPRAYQHAKASNAVSLNGISRVLSTHKERVEDIGFSKDGSVFASVDWAFKLVIWNSSDWTERFVLEGEYASGIAFSPDNGFVSTQRRQGGLAVIDLTTGQEVMKLAQGQRGFWAPDSKRIAAFPRIGAPIIYDAMTGREVMRFPKYETGTHGFAISSDFARLAAPTEKGLDLVDTASRSVVANVRADTRSSNGAGVKVSSAVFSPDNSLIAVLWSDKTGALYSTKDGESVISLPEGATKVEFSPDGQKLVVDVADDQVALIDVESGQQLAVVHGSLGFHRSFLQEGQLFSTLDGGRKSIQIYDAASGHLTAEHSGHATAWMQLASSPDGTTRVTTSGDGQLRIWDTSIRAGARSDTNEPLAALPAGVLAQLSDAEQVVRRNGRVVLTNRANGYSVLNGHRGDITAARFTGDGSQLVTGGEDGRLLFWDKDSASLRHSISGACEETVLSILPTNDAEAVWVYCLNGELRLFETASGRALITQFALPPGSDRSAQMSFSEDGKVLQLQGADGPYRWRVVP